MANRFRMIAGPNGSGKSTLVDWLRRDFAVNFYSLLNADDVFAQVKRTQAFFPPFPVSAESLKSYASLSGYSDVETARFACEEIHVERDCVRFETTESVNSYTVALLVNFLQDECINRGVSFSQETVFSHPSKLAALRKAKEAGFRTYLYYVATETPAVNAVRVLNRFAQGGHDVPPAKIVARHGRSLAQVAQALPYLSRAFFFDNSSESMRFLASYSEESGLSLSVSEPALPRWFATHVLRTISSVG